MRTPDFDDLLGPDAPPQERERLRRVHDALVAAGPPPELSPALATPPRTPQRATVSIFPRRRLAATALVAAALAAAAFGAGYLVGADDEFETAEVVQLRGTEAAPGASASLRVGKADAGENIPMVLDVRGLEPLPGRGYYELYLVRDGRPLAHCGSFDVADEGPTRIRLSASYELEGFDGWVITKHVPPAPASEVPLLSS